MSYDPAQIFAQHFHPPLLLLRDVNMYFVCVPEQQKWRVKVLSPELHGPVYLTRFQPPNLTWKRTNDTEVNIDDVASRRVLLYHAHQALAKHGVSLGLHAESKRVNSADWVRQYLQDVVLPPPRPDPDLETPQSRLAFRGPRQPGPKPARRWRPAGAEASRE